MENRKKVWQIISYSIVFLVVAGLSVALALAVERQEKYRADLENMYEKSYYDTMSSVSLMETNLDKLSVSSERTMQKTLLSDICKESERAESNLAQLNSKDESIDNIIKFLNQLGDYCNYLSKKVEDMELSEKESQEMEKFAEHLSAIWQSLQKVQEELMRGGSLMGKFNANLNYLTEAFSSINNSDIEFPEMNYDGPFSDDVIKRREPEALKDKPIISLKKCIEKVKTFFPGKNVEITKTAESGEIYMPYYIFDIKIDNISGTMQLSKRGGMLISYESYKEINTPEYQEEQCLAKAKEFLTNAGYEGLEDVWTSNYDSTLYVNFAYVQNETIIYPDLIKVKIACDTGNVIGFEAQNYLYNHKTRSIQDIDIEDINYQHNPNYTLEDKRIALIPTEFNDEKLVAEYILTKGEDIFYVYVNVETLEEDRILKQIDDNGKMLV